MNTWKIAQFNIRQSLIWKPWPPSSQTKQFSIFDCQHCRLLFQNRMQCRTHLAAKKSFAKKLLASCANSWCKTSKRYFPNLIHILIAINFRMPRATKLSWSKKLLLPFFPQDLNIMVRKYECSWQKIQERCLKTVEWIQLMKAE